MHAIEGQPSPKTIMMTGFVGKRAVNVLIDGGSTHNILDPSAAKRLGCLLESTPSMEVTVADGSKLTSNLQCKEFQWKMGVFSLRTRLRFYH